MLKLVFTFPALSYNTDFQLTFLALSYNTDKNY